MAGLASAMLDSFSEGYTYASKLRAQDAAQEKFGDRAGNPGLFGALENQEMAKESHTSNMETAAQSRDIRGTQESRAASTHATQMDVTEDQRKQQAVVGLVNGLRSARDGGQDVGEAFDQQMETLKVLGVSEDDIPAMRQAVVDNPAVLDDYYAALTGGTTGGSKGKASDREKARQIMNDKSASDSDRKWASKVMGIDEDDVAGGNEAAEDVSAIVGELRGLYEGLEEGAGITNPQAGVLSNATRWLRSSWAGRSAGAVTGTENESFRRSIEAIRPHLLLAVKAAESLGARMFDSNKDMEMWLSTVTDPTQDYVTVQRALDQFERQYGAAIEEAQGDMSTLAPGFKDPETGAVFKGGDPGLESSWEMP